ncbi:MAG TPA: tetratricopeptide repeat protein [Phnomibacter sp.]|nr:tetratricopeptide repeat protein [Phnomibacter sp.]
MQPALQALPHDTLKMNMLLNLAEAEADLNMEQALAYSNQALQLARQIKKPAYIAKSLLQLAYLNSQSGQKEAASQAIEAEQIITQLKHPQLQAELNAVKGNLKYRTHLYPEGLEYFMEALRQYEALGDSSAVAKTTMQIGGLLYFSKNLEEAKVFLERAERLCRSLNKPLLLSKTLSAQSNVYNGLNQPKVSGAKLREALAIQQQLNNYAGMAVTYTNLGMDAWDVAGYDSTLFYFEKAFYYDSLSGNKLGMLYGQVNLAAVYRKLKMYEKALEVAHQALITSDSTNDLHLKKTILEDLSELYADLDNPTEALRYLRLHNQVTDSLYGRQKSEALADLHVKYDVEKKELSLKQLQQNQRQQRNLLIALAALVLVLMILAVTQRALQKNKLRLAAEKLQRQEDQLAGVAEGLLQKDELINEITSQLDQLKAADYQQRFEQLEALLNARLSTQDDWTQFQVQFERLYPHFFARLQQQFAQLTPTEVKLCALEKLGLRDTQASNLLGVNPESIRKGRYRLRKSLGDEGWEQLQQFLRKA